MTGYSMLHLLYWLEKLVCHFLALLFGFTFYIQSANQQRKGKDFGYRFLWRLLLLVAFATLNAAFFYRQEMCCCCSQ